MIVGFTGTREGMTLVQRVMFEGVLARLCPDEFHHGDCLGADAEAHNIVRKHAPRCKIIIHPPIIERDRAFLRGDETREPRDYLDRNRAIVFCCDELVAVPKSRAEELRSGTWMTVRAARRSGKRIHMVWP